MSKLEDDLKFLKEAYSYANEYSTDPDTKTGVVIVKKKKILVKGANHAPKDVLLTNERLERPLKYSFIEHAERNAIYKAAKQGIKIKGSTLYSPWFPCAECARAIIQSGIEELVCHQEMEDLSTKHMYMTTDNGKVWDHSQYHASMMFKEAGVSYRKVSGKIGGIKILFRGKIFEP